MMRRWRNVGGATGGFGQYKRFDDSTASALFRAEFFVVSTGGINATATGELADLILTPANATVAASGNATGSLPSILITSIGGGAVGGLTVDGNASGQLPVVSVSAMNAGIVGASNVGGALIGLVVSAISGLANGGANTSSQLAGVIVSPISGNVTVGANAVGSFADILLSAFSGALSGNATTVGQLSTVSLSPLQSVSIGGAGIGGQLTSVILSPLSGGVFANAGAVGSLADIIVGHIEANAGADTAINGALAGVSLGGMNGVAIGDATGLGGLVTVDITPMVGGAEAGSSVNVSGRFGQDIAVSGIYATASVEAIAGGFLTGINLLAIGGNASSNANAYPRLSDIIVSEIQAQSFADAYTEGSLNPVFVDQLNGVAIGGSVGVGVLSGLSISHQGAGISAGSNINASNNNVIHIDAFAARAYIDLPIGHDAQSSERNRYAQSVLESHDASSLNRSREIIGGKRQRVTAISSTQRSRAA